METRVAINVLRDRLKKLEIFRHLSESETALLLENLHYKELRKGNILYREGCYLNKVILLFDGVVKQKKCGSKGKELIIRFAKGGEILGFRSFLTEELACATAEVMEDVKVAYIEGSCLTQLMKSNSNFSMIMMKHVCGELSATQTFILNVAQKTVRERVAEGLVQLKEVFDVDDDCNLKIPLSRRDLANVVGTVPESVIRMLADFKKENLIEVNGRRIRLMNIQKLTRIGSVAM
ncbi:Crp/Fnr family transcriptional regulator [Carboxylicivirga sp. N1Y90]|uniref:Crp/Fnr family transcriptional regulator n=1 Tax=Carboxylicivirga fragile TaxID=3417571 RepID=UPI003D33E32C|nr:Crp/Fnr family transcriptional regulator [Marinilabiliaceae bacterium N1Y90]